jgi:hypothetical protein
MKRDFAFADNVHEVSMSLISSTLVWYNESL